MHKFCLAAALAAPLCAGTLTPEERSFLTDHLQKTRKVFLDAIAGLSEEQWKFKPAPDRWSIAECAEHIAITEDFLFGLVTDKILKAPIDPELKSTGKEGDEIMLKRVVDRSHKATAPEPARPTGRFPTQAATAEAFNKSRDRTIEFVQSTQEDFRGHVSKSPLGVTDAYQFMLLLSGHAERHTLQINEVKAHPGYPKK